MELELKTERLILRPFRLEDAPRVRQLAGVWEIASMLAALPHPYPEGLAESWIVQHDRLRRAGAYPFAACRGDELIGSFGIEEPRGNGLELGYWVGVPYWGQGFATEAAQAVVDFAFKWLVRDHLRAAHLVENAASARVLAKLGFVATGRGACESRARGAALDCIRLVLKREDYLAKSGIN